MVLMIDDTDVRTPLPTSSATPPTGTPTDAPMKILFVNDDLQGGGKQRRLVQLLRGLEADPSLELHLVLLDHRQSAGRTGRSGIQDVRDLVDFPEVWSYRVRIHFLERSGRRDPTIFPRLKHLVRSIRPDIVNVWSVMGSFYALPVLLGTGIPLVTSFVADCNGPRFPSPWWLLVRCALAASRRVTGNSAAGLRAYEAPVSRSQVIHNGFDFGRFDDIRPRTGIREDLGIPTGLAVAMAARFDPTKDYATFLEGFLEVAKRRPDITAVCIGQGPDLAAIQAMVPGFLRDRVVFTGYRNDIESILAACDVSVLCTNARLHGEGISNSIMEGMAAGHPVVATNAGGSPEIVVDGETGFLVPAAAPEAVTRCLTILLDDPALLRRMGDASRDRISRDFSLTRMTREFRDLFASVGRSR